MLESLPGFREFYPEACSVRNHLMRLWRQTANRFGFQEFDAPTLEPLELYTEKSGPEIATQLFAFVDRGDRSVALRPEMTPRLAVMVGAKAQSLRRPLKWFSIGEQFRFERPQKGRLRSFYQFNADILGESGPGADAEIIALSVQLFSAFGLSSEDIVVRLSDRVLWLDYLGSYGLEGEVVSAVLQIIDKIEREDREKILVDLAVHLGDKAEDFLSKVDRLLQVRTLADLKAFMSDALEARTLASIEARLEDWDALLSYLNAVGLGSYLCIDLSIVRGLAYYTGFVFEIFERRGKSRALAGGGRYDHLVKKLGGPDFPAVGVGVGDVTLTDLLKEKKLLPAYITAPDFYVIIGGEAERMTALADIALMRRSGFAVEYPLKAVSFSKQFKLAHQWGARFALVYGSKELGEEKVKVYEVATRTEKLFDRAQLIPYLSALLEAGTLEDEV